MNLSSEEAFHKLSYYTLSHKTEEFIHQHIVDAYGAQTADKTTKNIKIAFALIGLYLHIEKKYSGKMVQNAHTQLAKYKYKLPTIHLPEKRGEITVFDVLDTPEGEARDTEIEKWMMSVWSSYASEHEEIADFLKRYFE